MSSIELAEPSALFEASHAALIQEFRSHNEELVPWVLDKVGDDFPSYLEWLKNQSLGVGLNEGFVPNATYWLVRGNEVLGVTNIRYELTPQLLKYGGHVGYGVRPTARRQGYATKMLALSLEKLKERGIKKVRITCVRENFASRKTILNNGGALESEEYMPEHGAIIQRYWVQND